MICKLSNLQLSKSTQNSHKNSPRHVGRDGLPLDNDTLLGSDNVNTTGSFDGRAGDDHIDGRDGFDQAIYNGDPAVTSGQFWWRVTQIAH